MANSIFIKADELAKELDISRGLAYKMIAQWNEELKAKGITVTAVCPGPMATEFLAVGHVVDSRPFELLPYCDQVQVAGGALRAARAGQTIYTPRLFYKFYRLLAKLTPAKLMVKLTKT